MKTLGVGTILLLIWAGFLWFGRSDIALPFGAIGGLLLGVGASRR
jgi:hypothetical protein